jgi:hypothetical protein
VKILYVYPQRLYKYGLIAAAVVGIVMVLAFGYRVYDPAAAMHPVLDILRNSGVVLLVTWLVLGASMYTNAISRLLIWAGLLLTWPVPIRDIFGIRRLDHHPAWPALNTFINFNEAARPIFASPVNADVLADWLVRTIRKEVAAPPNRATPPARPSGLDATDFRERLGNSLLMGCVIEEGHYRSAGFPRRDWGGFYEAVGEVATKTTLLSSDTLRERYSQANYYRELLNELNNRLLGHEQPTLPDSPKLLETLQSIFEVVGRKYGGAVTGIDPAREGWFRRRSDIIYDRVKELSLWDSEAMQAQFVKLAIVWNIWEQFPIGEFVFPVTKRIAALLLDRNVILAPEDLRALTFDTAADRFVSRTAETMVVASVISLVETDLPSNQSWLPKASQGTHGELLRWWIAYEVDFRLWDYATRLGKGETIPDDAGLTRWHLSYGQVVRVKKP